MAKPKRDERWWLTTSDYPGMMDYLGPRWARRKRVLFGCATHELIRPYVHNQANHDAVAASERYAEGLIERKELEHAYQLLVWERPIYSAWHIVALTDHGTYRHPTHIETEWLNSQELLEEVKVKTNLWADCVREVMGNPFRPVAIDPSWLKANDHAVLGLAQTIYEEKRVELMPILRDALEEAGCASADLLGHLSETGPHFRGCWAIDLLLGKD